MSETRLYQVLLGSVVSEKGHMLGEKQGKVVFEVLPSASKQEIAQAIKLLFDVDVGAVNTVVVKGKAKRSGRFVGVRKDRKKAYVTVPSGQENNFSVGD